MTRPAPYGHWAEAQRIAEQIEHIPVGPDKAPRKKLQVRPLVSAIVDLMLKHLSRPRSPTPKVG